MNENEMSGQTDQGSETLTKSPQKAVDKSKSPFKGTDVLKSPLKANDPLGVETPFKRAVENGATGDFTPQSVDDSTLKPAENSKNLDISTIKSTETPKSADNGTLPFKEPTLKALVTRKILEYSKLPLMHSEARLKGDALLKSLLSASTAFNPKMITTTEVTDENRKLRKILYQADKSKCDEREFESPFSSGNNASDSQVDEDERRLVIDIPDEMNHKINRKSMPSLESVEDEREKVSKMPRPSTLNTAFVSTRPLTRQPTAVQDSEYIPE